MPELGLFKAVASITRQPFPGPAGPHTSCCLLSQTGVAGAKWPNSGFTM